MIQLLETVKTWFWGILDSLGIITFLGDIGVWPALFLAVAVGLVLLAIFVAINTLLCKIRCMWLKCLVLPLFDVLCLLMLYTYVDCVISVIGLLGGLL